MCCLHIDYDVLDTYNTYYPINIINFSLLWLARPAGGWGTVRLQVRMQPRRAFLHGFPRQPEAESEGRPRRHPAPKRGGRPRPAQLRGGGSVPGRGGGAVRPGTDFPRQLPVLDSQPGSLRYFTGGTWMTEQCLRFLTCKQRRWIHQRICIKKTFFCQTFGCKIMVVWKQKRNSSKNIVLLIWF